MCMCACMRIRQLRWECVWTLVYTIAIYKQVYTYMYMYYMSGIHEHEHEHFSKTCCAENTTWMENLTPITVKKSPGPKVLIPRFAKEIFFISFTPILFEVRLNFSTSTSYSPSENCSRQTDSL